MRPRLLVASAAAVLAAASATARVPALAGGPRTAWGDENRSLTAEAAEARLGRMEERIPALMDRFGVPGLNVLVLRGGVVAASGSFGFADPATGVPMTPDAVFRVESISKPVTAWGVMRLVEEGLVGLDDPVQRHLRSWTPPAGTPPLTVAALLSHTAGVGLGDYTARFPPDGAVPSLPASLSAELTLVAPPGEGFVYSDTGFNLLQLLVEDVTGETFAAYMRREVLAPLGMTDATFRWTRELAGRIPTAHTLRGAPVRPYVYPGQGSGGLFATVRDVGRFLQAGMDPPHRMPHDVLGGASIARLHAPVVDVGGLYGLVTEGYGLGHFTEHLSDGRRAVWHGGQGYGWMSHAHLVPATGDGIVLLANSQRAWPLFARILHEWSGSLGIAPVGMARVAWAAPVAWAITGLLVVGAGLLAWRRRGGGTASIGGSRRRLRPVRGVLGLGLLGLVAWAATRDYLVVHSVVPEVVGWLGGACVLLGLLLVATACRLPVPRRAVVAGAAALVLAPGALGGQEPLARMELTRFPSSTVARARSGPFDRASVAVIRGSFVFPVAYRSPRTLLAVRLSGSRVAIEPRPLDPSEPLWTEALYDVDLELIGGRRVGERWWLTLVATPGLAGDLHDVGFEHLGFQGTALLTLEGDEGVSWGVGGTVNKAFGETLVLPLLSVEWMAAGRRVSVLAPSRASASWQITDRIALGLRAAVDGNAYAMGREGTLHGGVIRYSVVEVGPAMEVGLARNLRLSVAGGLSLARRLEAEDAGGTRTEDAALRRGVSLGLALSYLLPEASP